MRKQKNIAGDMRKLEVQSILIPNLLGTILPDQLSRLLSLNLPTLIVVQKQRVQITPQTPPPPPMATPKPSLASRTTYEHSPKLSLYR